MCREHAVEELDELSLFRLGQPRQKFVLNDAGVFLKHCEVGAPARCNGDDVTAAIVRIRPAFDQVRGFETGHDAVDVVPVQAQDPPQVGLAEGTLLHQAREHCEVGSRLRWHVLGRQPRTDRRHPTGLPADQRAQRLRNPHLVHGRSISVGITNGMSISLVRPTLVRPRSFDE
jgi:hypothetical protein